MREQKPRDPQSTGRRAWTDWNKGQEALKNVNRFVLNSAVIPGQGKYEYVYKTVEEAKHWLALGSFKSGMRYEAAADAMQILLGVRPDIGQHWTKLDVGDEALVLRLHAPALREKKRTKLTADFVAKNCEIGILTRTG